MRGHREQVGHDSSEVLTCMEVLASGGMVHLALSVGLDLVLVLDVVEGGLLNDGGRVGPG